MKIKQIICIFIVVAAVLFTIVFVFGKREILKKEETKCVIQPIQEVQEVQEIKLVVREKHYIDGQFKVVTHILGSHSLPQIVIIDSEELFYSLYAIPTEYREAILVSYYEMGLHSSYYYYHNKNWDRILYLDFMVGWKKLKFDWDIEEWIIAY